MSAFAYEDSDELDVWKALDIQNATLDVLRISSYGSADALFRRQFR
jgi:hypothetical protein